jgi:hypothetical protein
VDVDGITPTKQVTGEIQIKPDQPPRIRGELVTQFFRADAQPDLHYQADDDVGVQKVSLHLQKIGEENRVTVPISGKVLLAEQLPSKGVVALDLRKFSLSPNDEVKIILEVTDYRGDRPGRSTLSQPIFVSVTNEAGILRVLRDEDRKALESIDKLIEEQLKTGGKP